MEECLSECPQPRNSTREPDDDCPDSSAQSALSKESVKACDPQSTIANNESEQTSQEQSLRSLLLARRKERPEETTGRASCSPASSDPNVKESSDDVKKPDIVCEKIQDSPANDSSTLAQSKSETNSATATKLVASNPTDAIPAKLGRSSKRWEAYTLPADNTAGFLQMRAGACTDANSAGVKIIKSSA